MHVSLRSAAVPAFLVASFSATIVAAQGHKAALVPRFALAKASSECNAEK